MANRLGDNFLGSQWDTVVHGVSVKVISIDLIDPPEWQPRQKFEVERLNELKNSIAQNGLLQPIAVEQISDRFRIVSGERRYRAIKELNFEVVPVHIINKDGLPLSDNQRLQIQIAENLMREDITPLERAKAVEKLFMIEFPDKDLDWIFSTLVDYQIDKTKLPESVTCTVHVLLEKLCKSASTVTRWLKLLKLPEDVQIMLDDPKGPLTPKHAGELLKLQDINQQRALAKKIEELGLSSEAARDEVEKIKQSSTLSFTSFYRRGKKYFDEFDSILNKEVTTDEKFKILALVSELESKLKEVKRRLTP